MTAMAELGIEDREMTDETIHPLHQGAERITVTVDVANILQSPAAEVGVEVHDQMDHRDGADHQAKKL